MAEEEEEDAEEEGGCEAVVDELAVSSAAVVVAREMVSADVGGCGGCSVVSVCPSRSCRSPSLSTAAGITGATDTVTALTSSGDVVAA